MDKVRYVDSKEAAAMTGKSPQHLAVLAGKGRCPGVKRVGTANNGVWLFPVVDGGIVIAPAANPVGRPKRFSPIHARRAKMAAAAGAGAPL